MRAFFLATLTGVSGEGMVEGFPVDILRMRRKMVTHGIRQIGIGAIWHDTEIPL